MSALAAPQNFPPIAEDALVSVLTANSSDANALDGQLSRHALYYHGGPSVRFISYRLQVR
jgi:hypothetical protein